MPSSRSDLWSKYPVTASVRPKGVLWLVEQSGRGHLKDNLDRMEVAWLCARAWIFGFTPSVLFGVTSGESVVDGDNGGRCEGVAEGVVGADHGPSMSTQHHSLAEMGWELATVDGDKLGALDYEMYIREAISTAAVSSLGSSDTSYSELGLSHPSDSAI